MNKQENTAMDGEGETQPASAKRSSLAGAMGVTLVGFVIGLIASPFKGALQLAAGASVAFTCWLIYTTRGTDPIIRVTTIVATLLVFVPLTFATVGYLHSLLESF